MTAETTPPPRENAPKELPFRRPERKPGRAWVPIVLVLLAALFGLAIALWPSEDDAPPAVRVIDAGAP